MLFFSINKDNKKKFLNDLKINNLNEIVKNIKQ